MSTESYKKKRAFDKTSEPEGTGATSGDELIFTVQKHDASHLHYDLRLEMDGALKSWAVPRGPSLDPSVKRLAILVEDHPMDYARFEGVIGEGNYGAGKVIVWDTGFWQPIGDYKQAFAEGNLKFLLFGEKLQGKWVLIRTKDTYGNQKENWLLIKERDTFALSEDKYMVTNQFPRSVLTGRDINDVEQLTKPVQVASKAKRSRSSIKPASLVKANQIAIEKVAKFDVQLAVAAAKPPTGDDWFHEIKLDGYRMVTIKNGDRVKLVTRSGIDWTKKFSAIAKGVQSLPCKTAVLDGEIVRLRPDGLSDFSMLQQSITEGEERKLKYFAFDLMYADGFDLRNCELKHRKELLSQTLQGVDGQSAVQYCEHVVGHGEQFFEQCRKLGTEGMVSKLARSAYRPGRIDSWRKSKCILSDDFVIGGYTPSDKRSRTMAALVLGYFENEEFRYVGKVGTGFSDKALLQLKELCDAKAIKRCPFASIPEDADVQHAIWTQPTQVVRVNYINLSSSKILRHASFVGLRDDIAAKEIGLPLGNVVVVSAEPKTRKWDIELSDELLNQLAQSKLSNPQKIYYPATGITKMDIVTYYVSISERILPYIVSRPVSLNRYPDGIEHHGFVQKHPAPGMSPAIVTIDDPASDEPLLGIENVQGLAGAVQLGTLEIHPWSATTDRLDRPDRIIFDFDPDDSISFAQVRDAAVLCRETLEEIGLQSFVKTSGGKGVHVVVPIERRIDWEETLKFARKIAERIERQDSKHFTTNMSKHARKQKILIDIHRNHRGATCVAAYSARSRPGATVSWPMLWKQFEALDDPRQFDIYTAAKLASAENDPWAAFYKCKQRITKATLDSLAR